MHRSALLALARSAAAEHPARLLLDEAMQLERAEQREKMPHGAPRTLDQAVEVRRLEGQKLDQAALFRGE